MGYFYKIVLDEVEYAIKIQKNSTQMSFIF